MTKLTNKLWTAKTLAQTGITRGVVRTPADSLPADNDYHFALSPDQRIGVVIVDGASGGQGSFFLERALAIGDAPGFRTVLRREGEGDDAKLTISFPGYGLKKIIEKFAGIREE